MPKVTVIVPNYNHGPFLNQRIDSVLEQSYADFEVILMDDASSDGSLEVLQSYASDSRVRLIMPNTVNTGIPFKQWNKGVAEARGEYIWIAESDDFAKPALLATLVDVLDRHPNVGLAYCQSLAVDGSGAVTGTLQGWTDDLDATRWSADHVGNGPDECRRFVVQKCTIPNASAVVFRKDAYLRVGSADEDFRLSGDWMMWAKLLLDSDVAFVAEPLNCFRMHQNTVRSNSARTTVALQEAIRIYRYISGRVDVPDQVRDAVLERLLNRWVMSWSAVRPRLGTELEMYRAFRQLDRDINKRLVKRLTARLWKMAGLASQRPAGLDSPARSADRSESQARDHSIQR